MSHVMPDLDDGVPLDDGAEPADAEPEHILVEPTEAEISVVLAGLDYRGPEEVPPLPMGDDQ